MLLQHDGVGIVRLLTGHLGVSRENVMKGKLPVSDGKLGPEMGIAALLSCPVGKVATEPTYIQWEEL